MMKGLPLLFVLFACIIASCGHQFPFSGNTESAILLDKVDYYKTKGYVQYSDFGALGNGKTDDIDAIFATHAFANKYHLSVKANKGAAYYIGAKQLSVVIQTNTDFGNAEFIVDDRKVQNREAPIFEICSAQIPLELKGISSLKKNQPKIDVSLSVPCLIIVENKYKKRYIRFGLNQNDGFSQKDVFIVDKKGNVNKDTPIIWGFDTISNTKALPIDSTQLLISGGRFTTIANNAQSRYNYYSRNILIKRSNVVVDGLEHRIVEEGTNGAPYRGFITITNCSDVIVKNTLLSGHKTYKTIGAAGEKVSMGSYDISVNTATNISFVNCSQTNNINDKKYWGIMASNFSKNIQYVNCKLSRFDAHMGVVNATIRNSTLGYMGIKAIGCGSLIVENSTINAQSLINFRQDYGSTWQGKCIIRDCVFAPVNKNNSEVSILSGYNSGQHDFGYTCYMPDTIIIENLKIHDSNDMENYSGLFVFADFNSNMVDVFYKEKYPFIRTKKIILKNISTQSGKPVDICKNQFFLNDIKVERQ